MKDGYRFTHGELEYDEVSITLNVFGVDGSCLSTHTRGKYHMNIDVFYFVNPVDQEIKIHKCSFFNWSSK